MRCSYRPATYFYIHGMIPDDAEMCKRHRHKNKNDHLLHRRMWRMSRVKRKTEWFGKLGRCHMRVTFSHFYFFPAQN